MVRAMIGGEVIGLDLGSHRCGFACGHAGNGPPLSATLLLRRGAEAADVAFANLLEFLADQFKDGKPLIVAKEAPIELAAFNRKKTSTDAVRVTYGLHAIVEAVCRRFAVEWVDCLSQSVAKHFVGRGDLPRDAKKLAFRRRALQLGWVDPGQDEEDRCDALGVFEYACAYHARRAPRTLALFPPQAEKVRRRKRS